MGKRGGRPRKRKNAKGKAKRLGDPETSTSPLPAGSPDPQLCCTAEESLTYAEIPAWAQRDNGNQLTKNAYQQYRTRAGEAFRAAEGLAEEAYGKATATATAAGARLAKLRSGAAEARERVVGYVSLGYRKYNSTCLKSSKSLFTLHNESVNVWTHLVGGLYALYLALMHQFHQEYRSGHSGPLAYFCLCASICMLCSAVFHLYSNWGTQLAYRGLQKLDHTCIFVLISGSGLSLVAYIFRCDAFWLTFWCALIIAANGLGVFNIWVKCCRACDVPWIRASFYVFIGTFTGSVVPHVYMIDDPASQEMRSEVCVWVVLSGLVYIVGAVFYATHWPEKAWPGTFDIFGQGHQIFHLCVMAGAYLHYRAVLEAHDYLLSSACVG